MSTSASPRRFLLVLGAVALSACRKVEPADRVMARPPADFPLTVNVSCDNGVQVGLIDASGAPAWSVKAKKRDVVEWRPSGEIISLAITGKNSVQLPLDGYASGNGKGKPAKGTVSDSARSSSSSQYQIAAVCQPIAPGAKPISVTLDPDMIVQ
jgi:uncharacterized membrane protein